MKAETAMSRSRDGDTWNKTKAEGEAGLFASVVMPSGLYSIKITLVLMLMSICISLFGFAQTEVFISLMPQPNREELLAHMAKASEVQRVIEANYRRENVVEPPEEITVARLFGEAEKRRVQGNLEHLLSDEELNAHLKRSFGVTLKDARAVILPVWGINTVDDRKLNGLTDEGRRAALSAMGEPNIQAITIRDRDSQRQLTIDGVPRIILFPTTFYSDETLRLSLFHQLLHALNIPGRFISPITFLQDDLAYLPEYRFALHTRGFRKWTEYYIWLFGVVLPLVYVGYCSWRLLLNIKANKHRKAAISN